MPFKLNVFTGNLDLVTSNTGFVKGPPVSTDKAISRWSGTSGDMIQDSLATLQDSGAILAQGFITKNRVTAPVLVQDDQTWIAPDLIVESGGDITVDVGGTILIDG